MNAPLIGAVAFISVILLPIVRLYSSAIAAGAAGVLSGGAITYFLYRGGADNWGWAMLATIVAAIFYVLGLAVNKKIRKANVRYWLAYVIGVFGSLIPGLWGVRQDVKVETSIPWGALLTIAVIVMIVAALVARSFSKDEPST